MRITQEFSQHNGEEKTYLMMIKKLLFLIGILSLTYVAVQGQSDSRENYIKKYKKLAMKEMERTGVPASIKLAQGILESNAGKSTLAKKAKNHFGMKCGSAWRGKTYFLEDDDYDENGRLVKSCFRVYKKVEDSYVAHSEFLRDPRKKYRYGFLFNLDPTDYKAWARGLKKAGYATSPTYAEKLIGLIERHNLNKYDTMSPGDKEPDPADQILVSKKRFKVNGIQVVLADGEKTIRDIALNQEIPVKRLIKYNEKVSQQTDVPKSSSRVFLKNKRNGYRGNDKKYHQVKKGETMWDLSQRYGVKLSKLLKRNRLSKGEEPATGQQIKLRGWFKSKTKPKLRDITEEEEIMLEEEKAKEEGGFMNNEETIDFEEDEPEDFDTEQEEVFKDDNEDRTTVGNGSNNPAPVGPTFHVVKRGETLYGIARRYNTSVERIKNLNKLTSSNIISIGQRLRIK